MIRFIEELSMNAWPSLQTTLYDGWVLRVSAGYTKRANSVNPLYKSKIDLDQKIDYCKNFYERLRLPVVYKITSDNNLTHLDNKLSELNYIKIDETSVRVLDLSLFDASDDPSTKVSNVFTEEWTDAFIRSSKICKDSTKFTLKSMLNNIIGRTIWITHIINREAVGFGFGVIDNGYVGIFDILVDKSFRGNGYGKAIMNKILLEAKKLGANQAYLQVVVGNTVAENLYQNLGFEEIYRYWYRKL
ncbi:MAG: GNAT family N-acetyltransferase [Desulfobacterales bacterium]|nr:GNAT family N-acetyltransferase [Desulfobacterales bacterium]